MKNFIRIVAITIQIMVYVQSNGQVPQGFKYQAVCRDTEGIVIQNQSVNVRLSIHDIDLTGTIIYQETFSVTTSQFGLIILDVGSGNVQSGVFATISWEAGYKFLEVELDLGSGYLSMGTTQLLSVPYALHAETADSITGVIPETDPEVGSNTLNYLSKWDGYSLVSSSIIDNGRVGIGTNNPYRKLHIVGTDGGLNSGLRIQDPNNAFLDFSVTNAPMGMQIYGNQQSQLQFLIGGLSRMTIDKTGNIGMGTANPDKKLTVAGNAQIQSDGAWIPGASARLYLGPDDNMWIEHIHSGGLNLEVCSGWPLYFRNGGLVTMCIDGSGNVGIGTEYPLSLLDVNGLITTTGGNSDNWNTAYSWGNHAEAGYLTSVEDLTVGNEVTDATNSTLLRSGLGTHVDPYTLSLNLANENTWSGSQTFSANTNFPGLGVWTTTGKVGIGTSNPSAKLEVWNGNISVSFGGVLANTGFWGDALRSNWGGDLTLQSSYADKGIIFRTQSGEKMRIDAVGNVGIGIETPGAKLEVNGQVKITGGIPGAGKVLTSDENGLAIWESPPAPPSHYIGESYGGGIVFYIYDNSQHGLIAATSDQSAGIQWSNGIYRFTGTTGDGLGAGSMNTIMIVATQISDNQTGSFAAKVCTDYSITENGIIYGDWYLPSKYESDLLFLEKDVVGGFSANNYWTSTEESFAESFAKYKYFGTDAQVFPSDVKYYPYKVRAIRSF